jgi:hypothetical protein
LPQNSATLEESGMDQARYSRPTTARASHRPTSLAPIWQGGAPRRPAPAPTPTPTPTPVHHAPIIKPAVAHAPHPAPVHPPVRHHQPALVASATSDSPTVSIRITVPDSQTISKLLSWRPSVKQVFLAFVALCIFTVGYQAGRHTAMPPPPQPASVPTTRKNA